MRGADMFDVVHRPTPLHARATRKVAPPDWPGIAAGEKRSGTPVLIFCHSGVLVVELSNAASAKTIPDSASIIGQ
jgi:hypothetical protein